MDTQYCEECDKTYPVAVWPLRCICGNIYEEDGRVYYHKARGLGDTLAKITAKLGIRPCKGCKKRQKKFNKWFPYEKSR